MTNSLSPETRILVTGGHGFLGSFVVELLQARGCRRVIAPTRADYDLRLQDAIARLLAETRPQVVIHMAALVGGIQANVARPGEFFYDNLIMGTQLMEQSRLAGVTKFISIGTVCAYPKRTPVPFREENLWDGYPEETNAPYGLARKMLLVQGQAYRAQYGFNAIYLMPVNLYGPRDSFGEAKSHVIPALIKRFTLAHQQADPRVVVWGDGSQTREFLYVEEAARAICLALERYNGGDPVNLGAGKEISIRVLAELIRSLVGYQGEIVWDTTRPNGQPRRCLDTSRAEREFGFRSTMPFEEGLKRTIAWYEQQHAIVPISASPVPLST